MSLPTDRSTGPDEKMLNEALEELRFGERAYARARLRFRTQMLDNGYTLEEYESHFNTENCMHLVHSTVLDGWQDGLEDDSKGLIARRLVVKV